MSSDSGTMTEVVEDICTNGAEKYQRVCELARNDALAATSDFMAFTRRHQLQPGAIARTAWDAVRAEIKGKSFTPPPPISTPNSRSEGQARRMALRWTIRVMAGLIVLYLACWFGTVVWPTAWRYEHSGGYFVRVHRSTGRMEIATPQGWRSYAH